VQREHGLLAAREAAARIGQLDEWRHRALRHEQRDATPDSASWHITVVGAATIFTSAAT
jgi:hypothetical protein